MAYKLKQENYDKRASSDARKLLIDGLGQRPAAVNHITRIEAHLLIRQLLQDPAKQAQFREWKQRIKAARARRREGRSNAR